MSKTLDDDFAAHVAQTVTTLAWCWKLTRTDGVVQGFTDHDRDLAFDGLTYAAATGFTASQIQSNLEFAVDNLEVSGAFRSDSLNEDDLSAGIYDGASIEIYRVNWASPDQHVLIRKGTLGEVKRGKAAFQAEIRGLMQALNQPVGNAYCYACDADVGDSRCGVDLTTSTHKATGTVLTVTDNRRFSVSGLSDFAGGWFAGGKLTWASGSNSGRSIEIKRHSNTSASVILEIWQETAFDIAVGDTFTVTVGCDKQFSTCKKKFSNGANFRGFPYMIGNDAVVSYAMSDTDMDGGSRYGN
jgi:uncharacterized phage protein (TIGR02218 family)